MSTASKTVVTGICKSRVEAEQAIDRLIAGGFLNDDISVLMNDSVHGKEFKVDTHTKAPEGAAAGAAIGGTLGAIAAAFATVGALAIPGAQIVAAGPLIAALTGAGAGGAAGTLIGGLAGLGVPEHEAEAWSKKIEDGNILIAVECESQQIDDAKKILKDIGVDHVWSN